MIIRTKLEKSHNSGEAPRAAENHAEAGKATAANQFSRQSPKQPSLHASARAAGLSSPKEQRRLGAWYGLAVGDALGAPFEFMDEEEVSYRAPPKLTMSGGGIWAPGEWTDDTALTLATSAAYHPSGFSPHSAAQAMVGWLNTDPKDIGNLTRLAIELLRDGRASFEEAGVKALSLRPGSKANGSLMRALPTALVRSVDEPRLVDESKTLSLITHADPRCVDACVVYNAIIASLIDGKSVDQSMAVGERFATNPDVKSVLTRVTKRSAPLFTNAGGIGFVLLALERGLTALRDSPDYQTGIEAVVRMGGDSDTNAAIAGALLGARFGYESIPQSWLTGLRDKDTLHEAYSRLEKVRDSDA